jgi:hypothetical protein
MPQPSPAAPRATPMSPEMLDGAARAPVEDPDVPLGCECADPTLQIERWRQEAPGAEPS